MNLTAAIVLLIGALFLFLGALGLLRMPDVFTRIQAGTKAVTLGSLAVIVAVMVARPEWIPKLLIIALFILLTSPIGSSAIARAARLSGLEPWRKSE